MVYFLPWWVLLACLAASAFAVYLLLGRTQAGDSPWTLFPLTAVLVPVVLVGAAVVAITLSTLLSAPPEDRIGEPTSLPESPPPEPPTRPEATQTTPAEGTVPATSTPSASPSASPGASPTASSSASPSP
jgi:hypothetical protein